MSPPVWRSIAVSAIAALLCACTSVGTKIQPLPAAYVQVLPPGPFEIQLISRSFKPEVLRPDWEQLLAKGDQRGVHAIVQLNAIPDIATRVALTQAGVELGQPLSGNAYLATLRPNLDRKAAVLTNVRWAGSYQAADKLAPGLKRERGLEWARRVPGRIELVVKLFADADFDAATAQAKALGGELAGEARAAQTFVVSLPVARQTDLAQLDAVRFVEPSVPAGNAESDRARPHVGSEAGAIPANRPTGNGVLVGVFEGGHAATNHGDLLNRVAQGDTGTLDVQVHPSMIAGLIAGDGTRSLTNGATFANQWRGIAPAAQIRSYSFTTTATPIADYLGDVTDAVQNDGVHVLNNSWGDYDCNILPYGEYLGRAPFLDGVVRGSLGRPVSIVFSAGNDRDGFGANNNTGCINNTAAPFINYTTVNHPKAAKNIITVGAVDSANNAMTVYSSWGPTQDGRIKPDVVGSGHHNGAMNSNVSSWTVAGQGYLVPGNTNGYNRNGMTSFAAAEVSGGLALMLDGWRRAFPNRADPLPSTLRAALVHSATDLDDATTWFNRGPDYASGYGLVRINASVDSLMRGDAQEGSVAHQMEARYFVNAPANGPLRITLAWDDEPAIEGANPTLVNDLDLVVTAPNSNTRHYPWTLDPANPSVAAVRTGEDHRNNLEQVVVDAPAAGVWTVVVRGTQVASGRQNFSLITENGFTRQPADLILALDTSDSMNDPAVTGGLDKIEVLRRSVNLLLNTWNLHATPSDRVGIAAFNSNVATIPNMLPALQPFQANFNAVTTAVSGLTASGCTALGGALQVALNSFDPNSSNKRSILLVTDGMQSANPFVGESATPSRQRIATFPNSGPLPFDAFFCTTTPANGPGGSAIVPDGIDVAAHNTDIHAIGVGVNGAGFQQLIQRLASENRGLHHFTTTPDTNLDILYINDLVRALKSNTLEVITSDGGSLGVGATRDIAFPVNATSRSITVVLSWQGATQAGAVSAQMRGPGGALLTPSQTRQQGYFTVLKFNLAGAPAVPGNWRLTLARNAAPALSYQVSVIADESCFHYDFASSATSIDEGRISLSARLSEAGRALRQPFNVGAVVSAPATSIGNLLAAALPNTKAGKKYLQILRAGSYAKLPLAGAVIENALRELNRDPEFLQRAGKIETRTIELKPQPYPGIDPSILGETRYISVANPFKQIGTYQVQWQVAGASACGPIQRQEIVSIVVGLGKIDRAQTAVTRTIVPRNTVSVRVKPVDQYGNLLGPGRASMMKIEAMGSAPVTPLLDLLDGTYMRSFTRKGTVVPGLKLTVDSENWEVPGKGRQ